MRQGDRERLLVLGAGGRDFHNFNVVYRDDPGVEVVTFTATQIPGIAGRRYPPSLAGPLYPEGIPIVDEAELDALLRRESIQRAVFAYSDVAHVEVMHVASRVLAAGADFALLGPVRTMLRAALPVIAISAVRTGCGKSQTARYLSHWLQGQGLRVAVLRHPMPYGDLAAQAVQRFASLADIDAAACTVEEREEYEPHVRRGHVVYAGVDYARILDRATEEADLILWDGGNNDFPFVRPDLHIVLVDALRPGHETGYHPGEAVLRMADVVVLAKTDCADAAVVQGLMATVRRLNPDAEVIRAASPVQLQAAEALRGRRVLVLEDGPTLTHGGMATGAGWLAATRAGAQVVDPRPWLAPELVEVFQRYPQIGPVLPAMGYSPVQLQALAWTLAAAEVDAVVSATPADIAALIPIGKPVFRAVYEFAESDSPGLVDRVARFLAGVGLGARDRG